VYLQQNAFDKIDAATTSERQKYVFGKIVEILGSDFIFENKDIARSYFYKLRHSFIDWNYKNFLSSEFKEHEEKINQILSTKKTKEYSETAI